jgi:hypothetical protein
MDLKACRVVLRPRSTAELFDLGLRFAYGHAAPVYRRLAWWLLVPAWSGLVTLRFGLGLDWAWVWGAALGTTMLLEGVFTIAASKLMFAGTVRVGDVLLEYLRRLPSYLVTLVLSWMVLALGWALFFLVVPVFWAAARVAHVHEASLLERAGPFEALTRAGRLVSRDMMATAWLQTLMVLHMIGFVLVFEAIGNTGIVDFVLQLGAPLGKLEWGGSAFALLGLLAAVPYTATVRFLAYIDRRTRSDGWDVQVECMAIANEDAQRDEEAAA